MCSTEFAVQAVIGKMYEWWQDLPVGYRKSAVGWNWRWERDETSIVVDVSVKLLKNDTLPEFATKYDTSLLQNRLTDLVSSAGVGVQINGF